MKIYVNKRTKNIKSFLFLFFLFISGTSSSILPDSFGFKFFNYLPFIVIIALIPLLADLAKKVFRSIALYILFAKC